MISLTEAVQATGPEKPGTIIAFHPDDDGSI
jgi:hypothetical protein